MSAALVMPATMLSSTPEPDVRLTPNESAGLARPGSPRAEAAALARPPWSVAGVAKLEGSTPSPAVSRDAPGAGLAKPVQARRAAADVLVQVVMRFGNLLLGIVATAVLARGLGKAGFGEWSTILLIPGLLAYLNDLGFQQVAVRRAVTEDDPGWLGALVSARLVLSPFVTLLSAIAIVVISRGHEMTIAGVILAGQSLLAAPEALASVFEAEIRNDLAMIAMTLNSLLWTGAVIALSHLNRGLIDYAIAMFFFAALTTGFQAVVATHRMRVPLRGTSRRWRPLAGTAVPLSIGSLLIIAYARIDGLIVYLYTGNAGAGIYNAAYRIVDQASFVPLSLIVTLMPIVARAHAERVGDVRRLLELSLELLAMFALPALGFCIVAGDPFMGLLFGSEFTNGGHALAVLMGAFVAICCGYALGVFTLVLDLQWWFVRYAVLALAVNVALNLLLVPSHGFIAAAWITLLTEVIVSGLIGRTVLRRLEMRLRAQRFLRTAAAAAASTLVVLSAHRAGLGIVGLIAAGGLVHAVCLFAFGALRPAQVRALLRRDPLAPIYS